MVGSPQSDNKTILKISVAAQSWTYTPGPNPEGPGTFVDEWFTSEEIQNADFSIAKDLSSANLNTQTSQGNLSISWKSTGGIMRTNDIIHYKNPDFSGNGVYRSVSRDSLGLGSVFSGDMGQTSWVVGRLAGLLIGRFLSGNG